MDLLALYYKKYTGTVQAEDYIEWANHSLYMDVLEIKILAAMGMGGQLNIFEVEEMFAVAMKEMQREAPTKEECLQDHFKKLHTQLLMSTKEAIEIVEELYAFTVHHGYFEDQLNWQEVSDMIDDFKYGDNLLGYTTDSIHKMIINRARRLWHTKVSKLSFKELIGKKVTAIDSEINFIILLDNGAIVLECPWRIRDTDGILLGETDIQSNQREWKSVKELLVGKTIVDIQLWEQCPLLIVQLDNLFLDVFHASSFFDGWTLTDDEDFYLFSMHGGDIA